MINKKAIIVLLIVIMAFSGCSPGASGSSTGTVNTPGTEPTTPEPATQTKQAADPIAEQLAGLSLEEKIGQMFIVGLDGLTVDENAKKMIENYYVGGFILFSDNLKNPDQMLELLNSLKASNSVNRIPLFLSVDQEGGRVNRMPSELKEFPANGAIGKINNAGLSFDIGSAIAQEIKAFGFNLDFAPVLDVNSNPQNPVIGDRSFGANAKAVSRLGTQTMKGLQAGGVIPVVKHFPGHGDTSVDSHIGLPLVDNDMDRLKSLELVPFEDAIKNGADVVMVAHILLNKIDPDNPSSLSKTIITGLLREQMKFGGVVITDDLTMGAILKNYDVGDAAVRAVNAGNDIVLVSHGYENEVKAADAVKKAVRDGTISMARVDESVYRILKLKDKYKLKDGITDSVDIGKINGRIGAVLGDYKF